MIRARRGPTRIPRYGGRNIRMRGGGGGGKKGCGKSAALILLILGGITYGAGYGLWSLAHLIT